jgi:hypothetical protein
MLFNNLRKTVYSHSDLTASKVQGRGYGEETFLYMEGQWIEVKTGLELLALLLTLERWASVCLVISCGCLMALGLLLLLPEVNCESWALSTCGRPA